MDSPDARCALVAAEQHGCVTLEQARHIGLSEEAVRRRVTTKRWRRVLPGVYVLRGAPATWEQRLFAAVLWVGEGGVVVGAAAAALWQLPDFGPGPVELATVRSKRSRNGIVVRRVLLEPFEIRQRGIFPVTTPARTLLDVAGTVTERQFDAAFHHCLHHRLTTVAALNRVRERRSRPGRRGAARFGRAVETYSDGDRAAGSPLEADLARRLHRSGFPPPRRQHEVTVGGRRRYLDFAWPAQRLAIEVDGYRWHSSRTAWESDRARLADLRRAGWTIIRVSHDDIQRNLEAILGELASHLL